MSNYIDGYDDYDEDYEPTQEEMEECDGMENTEVKMEKENLKIEFNTENFALEIIRAVAADVKKNLEKDRYNRGRYRAETKEYTFEEYLVQHLGIDDEVKCYLDKQVDEVRQQVNRDVKAAFDESTKAMLSNAVLQVLMANDTYKKIEGNIACIADRPQE